METQRTRAIGYRRVSDVSQVQNHSLGHQTELLTAAASARGWEIEIREESGGAGSGKSVDDRAVLISTLDELDAGQHDALIVTKLDRLARDTFDGLKILKRATANGWAVVVLDLNVDTSTAVGEAMVTVLWAFATYERRVILERTRMGRERARAAGKHLGLHTKIPDDVLVRISRERAAGRTLAQVAAELNADGITGATGRRWNTGTVSRAARSVTALRLTKEEPHAALAG